MFIGRKDTTFFYILILNVSKRKFEIIVLFLISLRHYYKYLNRDSILNSGLNLYYTHIPILTLVERYFHILYHLV